MLKYPKARVLGVLLAISAATPVIANDEGKALFGQCRACHAIGPDAKTQYGPVLNGVMNRAAMVEEGYSYSDAFKKASEGGLTWDNDTMAAFLAAPMSYISGTKMAYPGVKSDEDIQHIINYLSLFDEHGNQAGLVAETSQERPDEDPKERMLAANFVLPDHGVFHLGRKALNEEVAAWDIDVRPDGTGLPVGSGDALTGMDLYDAQCASCHGDFGEGTGRWPILAGGHDTLTEERPEKTIGSYWPYLSTVFDYVRRAMPFGNARSLSDDDVYAITAYLLYLNDEVDEEFELTSENFTSIALPNEANFIADNRTDEPNRQINVNELCMTDCIATPVEVTQRALVLDVTPDE